MMVTMYRWCTIAEKGRGLREDGGWMINDRRSIRTQYIVRSILVLQYGIVVDGIRMMMGTDNGSMMMRSAAGMMMMMMMMKLMLLMMKDDS